MQLLGISREDGRPELISYHDHNAAERAPQIVARLERGERVVLVSDAGTPTISDPGYRLVREAAARQIPTTALPGPVAGIVALSASGLPSDRFFFEGFLPAKSHARTERLVQLAHLATTIILYESPHRVLKTLADIAEVFGADHPVCLARELTKTHEEYLRSSCAEVLSELQSRARVRGEIVLILAPGALGAASEEAALAGASLRDAIQCLLDQGTRTRQIRDALAPRADLPSSELYALIEEIKRASK